MRWLDRNGLLNCIKYILVMDLIMLLLTIRGRESM